MGVLENLSNASKAISYSGDHPSKASPIYYASILARRSTSGHRIVTEPGVAKSGVNFPGTLASATTRYAEPEFEPTIEPW
jgi:hypothetical protein